MWQLRRPVQAPAASAEVAEQAAASAGLGLAVLAGFCRVPALAECQGVIEKAPLLLRVRGAIPSEHSHIMFPGDAGGCNDIYSQDFCG